MRSGTGARAAGWAIAALAAICGGATYVRALELRCARCGVGDSCQKVCRLVKEEKKVQVVCWGRECEDFCLPRPSRPDCKHCDAVCDEDDPKAPCTHPRPFVWTEWTPAECAKVFTKTKLMKKTVTKKVPSYKWVVEDLCEKCAADSPSVEPPPGEKLPPKPAVDTPRSAPTPAKVGATARVGG